MKETMYPCVRPTRRCFEGNDRLTGFFGALLKRCTRLQGPLTCIPWWRAKSGTDKRSEKRERREGSWEASSLSVRHILPRAKRMSPFPECLSRSRYLHLGFHASISETREQIGREKEKEGESRGSQGVLTLYVAFCPPLIILSLPSYSYLGILARQRHEPFGGEALIMRVQSTPCSRTARRLCRSRAYSLTGDPSVHRYVRTQISERRI